MADEVRVVTDLDALFGGMVDDATAIVRDECRTTAEAAVAIAQARLPRDTGATAAGLGVGPHGDGYRVTDPVPWSGHVHRAGSARLAVDELLVEPLVASFSDGGDALERIARRLSEGT